MKYISNVTVLIALACGVAASLQGFTQMTFPNISALSWDSLNGDVIFTLTALLVIALTSKMFRLNYLTTGALLFAVITLLTNSTWQLLVLILFWLSSYGLGFIVMNLVKVDPRKISAVYIALIGSVIYGTAVGLIAHYPINYPGLYGVALVIPLIASRSSVISIIQSIVNYAKIKKKTDLSELLITVLALFFFCVALMPEVGHDALVTHLFVPAHLQIRHEWSFDVTTYVWAVMPMIGDWIYAIAYMLGGELAARMINISFIFVLCWLIRDLVLWAGGNAIGAKFAILLFLATPLTFTEGSSLFIESVWTSLIIAGSLSIFKLFDTDGDIKNQMLLAGFFLGGALAAKAVTFNILPVFALVMLPYYRNWFRPNWGGTIALSLFIVFMIGGIPYATAYHLTGNPIFPFFNQIFKSPFWLKTAFEPPAIFEKGLYWDSLYQVTFNTGKFLEAGAGAAGFQWLILFIPSTLLLFFAKQRRGLILIFVSVLAIASTFKFTAYLRYVFPSFAWIAAAISISLFSSQRDNFVNKILVIFGGIVILLNVFFLKSGSYIGDLSIEPLLSGSGRITYLNNELPIRNAVDLINKLNLAYSPVAVFSSPLTAGLSADGLYPNWYNFKFQQQVSEAKTTDEMANLLIKKGVYYIILDSNWGTKEKRVLIENISEKLSEMGTLTVRRLESRYQFKSELLVNSDFHDASGWIFQSGKDRQSLRPLIASVSTSGHQPVPVVPGHRYKNSVVAQCADQLTQGRVQVNWLDSNSKFISTDIKVFDCSFSETSYSMEVVAPPRATIANVYVSGHTSIPIIFREVSFKL